MSKSPSQVLAKSKKAEEKDNDKDDKKDSGKRNSLLDFIAKAKKASKKD